jgi:hypothetical protein
MPGDISINKQKIGKAKDETVSSIWTADLTDK